LTSSAGGLKSIGASLLELSPAPSASALTLSDRGGARLGVRDVAGFEDPESGVCEFAGAELEVCAHTATLHAINKIKSELRIP
jgi:hypothetical protein